MCALIQTRVSPSVSVPVFFCQDFYRLSELSTGGLLLFPPSSMGREEHKDKLGWISCVAVFVPKLQLGSGVLCVFITNQEPADITNNSQIYFHPPYTNKKEKEPILFPFFVQLGSLHCFLLSRRAKEEKIREKFVILILTINSSTFKVKFLSLAIEYLFTEKYWKFLELQTYRATSQAFPG